MNYKNREQYKHLMRVLAVAAIVLLECAVFSVFWDRYYASASEKSTVSEVYFLLEICL